MLAISKHKNGLNYGMLGLPWCGADGKASTCSAEDAGVTPGCWEDPLEKGMAITPVFLPERIPWTEESGSPASMGLQKAGRS